MTRIREAGLIIGELPTGPFNALTDVAAVRVGHTTLIGGDFVTGFSTAYRIEHESIGLRGTRAMGIDEVNVMGGLFRAVVEAVKEAIVNSLCGAETLTGRDDHVAVALPVAEVLALIRRG
jgi:L-aminopeptidase/D-esterase-like protein